MNEFENNELNEESESGRACGDCAAEENGKVSAAEGKATGEKSACADCESEGGAEASACGCACGDAACEEGAEAKSGEAEEIGEDGSEACVEDEKYTPAYTVFCASVDEAEKAACSDCGCGEECSCCDENGEAEKKNKKSKIGFVYDYLETFCYALSLMMILFLFVFRYVSVDGESMMGTLHDKDKLIISDMFYTPETGDIVVINPESHGDNGEPIIKRVIATEGQTVYIDYKNWEVYVDGVKLDEPYIEEMRKVEQQKWGEDIPMNGTTVTKYKQEFTVSEGKVFVMGDNRNNSKDSRSREYGEMDENRILGRVILRITPNFGTVD